MTSNELPLTRKQRRMDRKRAKAMAANHGRMPASLSDALVGDEVCLLTRLQRNTGSKIYKTLSELLCCLRFEFYLPSPFT